MRIANKTLEIGAKPWNYATTFIRSGGFNRRQRLPSGDGPGVCPRLGDVTIHRFLDGLYLNGKTIPAGGQWVGTTVRWARTSGSQA
jgi:hypothetical protein